jgi:hypothetical protein
MALRPPSAKSWDSIPRTNYGDRCRVFNELVKRGHRIASERYGRA